MTPTTILIVDDELIIAMGLEKRLRGLGYTVVGTATTGEEAIEMATALRPDLIFMDVNLGDGIDGVEAAGRIRDRLGVPVVFLTAFSDSATIQRAKRTGPLGYVLKPFADKDIQTAIEIGLYRHEMERQLREHQEWLAATLNSMGDGVIATDDIGRVKFMNPLAERLTGRSRADALGRDVRDVFRLVGERTRGPVQNPVLAALERGGKPVAPTPDALLIDGTGAERPIDQTVAPIRDATGKVSGAVLVFRDVTERRNLEEHLRQAQKMEAIGRLAGGIAHDFNNIMTVVVGFSEILLGAEGMSADRRDAARHIHEAGIRAAALTQQIMAFSRKQILVPCELDLNTVARDMGAMLQRLIGEHIEFIADPDPNLGTIKADPTQVGQVFLNLAANARDAMPRGGRLVVRTANVELGEAITREHPDVKPGAYVLLSVADTGCGMPAEVVAHIFEPFFTTKDIGQGSGLGLATVHGIVKQSGGHMEVTSAVGVGTEFRIYLPRIEIPPPQPAGAHPWPAAPGHETVLLVEDEELVRRLAKMILQRSGYTVLEAANGLEAVNLATEHPGPIHLLLTDLMMPHLSGREVAERLGPIRPGLRVLFMSGYTEDEILRDGVSATAIDILQKPFSVAALTNKVRAVLDRA